MACGPAAVLARIKRSTIRAELIQRALRVGARMRLLTGRVESGRATVVIVNWNSRPYLNVALQAVEAYSPSWLRVIVVDNHSTDGSRAEARSHPRVKWISLPRNVGHELALDIGFLLARTEYLVALDVDAFPIAHGWLERLIGPLGRGYAVSGAHLRQGFVHPCCLAMTLERFVTQRHSFMSRHGSGRLAESAEDHDAPGWDTGWSISLREPQRYLIDRTGAEGPGDIGSWWDGLVYHNFYSTRFDARQVLHPDEVRAGITVERARAAWVRAVDQYFPQTNADP